MSLFIFNDAQEIVKQVMKILNTYSTISDVNKNVLLSMMLSDNIFRI